MKCCAAICLRDHQATVERFAFEQLDAARSDIAAL